MGEYFLLSLHLLNLPSDLNTMLAYHFLPRYLSGGLGLLRVTYFDLEMVKLIASSLWPFGAALGL